MNTTGITNPERLRSIADVELRKERVRDSGNYPTKYFLMMDNRDVDTNKHWRAIGVVSRHYTPVLDRRLYNALHVAARSRGEALTVDKAWYHRGGGRSFARFVLDREANEFTVPGDPSPIYPLIDVRNDHRGLGSLVITSGTFRLECRNGQGTWVASYVQARRHTRSLDIDEVVDAAVEACIAHWEDECAAMTSLSKRVAAIPVDLTDEARKLRAERAAERNEKKILVDQLIESTRPRYRPVLISKIRSYVDQMGETHYALLQAVTETEHRMPQSPTQLAWTQAQVERIRAVAVRN